MAAVNKVFLLGNLGSDLNVRHLPDGRVVANVNIATTEVWNDQEGNKVKHTEWHRLNFFARQAEIASEFLHKGSPVFIEGQLRHRKWQDKEGNDRDSTEIRVLNFQMLGSRKDGDYEGRGRNRDDESPRGERDKDEDTPRSERGKDVSKGDDGGGFDKMDEDLPW